MQCTLCSAHCAVHEVDFALTPTKVHLASSALQTSGPSMEHTIYNWLLSDQCTKIYQIGRCTDSPKRMTRLMLPPPLSPKPRVAHRSGSSLPVRWNPTTQLLQLYTGTDCIICILKTLGKYPQKHFQPLERTKTSSQAPSYASPKLRLTDSQGWGVELLA